MSEMDYVYWERDSLEIIRNGLVTNHDFGSLPAFGNPF